MSYKMSDRLTSPELPLPLPDDSLELKREIFQLRDEVVGLRAELGESESRIKQIVEIAHLESTIDPTAHIDYLKGVVRDLELQIEEIRESATWRLGRFVMSPIRFVKSLSRRSS